MVTWFYLGFMSGLRCDIICSAAAQWSYSRVSSIGGGQERLKEKLDRYKKDDVSVNKEPFEEERESKDRKRYYGKLAPLHNNYRGKLRCNTLEY